MVIAEHIEIGYNNDNDSLRVIIVFVKYIAKIL